MKTIHFYRFTFPDEKTFIASATIFGQSFLAAKDCYRSNVTSPSDLFVTNTDYWTVVVPANTYFHLGVSLIFSGRLCLAQRAFSMQLLATDVAERVAASNELMTAFSLFLSDPTKGHVRC